MGIFCFCIWAYFVFGNFFHEKKGKTVKIGLNCQKNAKKQTNGRLTPAFFYVTKEQSYNKIKPKKTDFPNI